MTNFHMWTEKEWIKPLSFRKSWSSELFFDLFPVNWLISLMFHIIYSLHLQWNISNLFVINVTIGKHTVTGKYYNSSYYCYHFNVGQNFHNESRILKMFAFLNKTKKIKTFRERNMSVWREEWIWSELLALVAKNRVKVADETVTPGGEEVRELTSWWRAAERLNYPGNPPGSSAVPG